MNYLNYEFFDEFKSLDNLCRDMYCESIDNRLGVTMYLEDMHEKYYQGATMVQGWESDYSNLKNARHLRNELAHSRDSISIEMCSQEDIDFVRSFKERILNQTDPLALLRERTIQAHRASKPKIEQPSVDYNEPTPNKHVGGIRNIFNRIIKTILKK